MSLRPFVIDCDTGRDDALTLWLALRAKLPLVAVIASYGNTTVSNVADNTARVLSLAGGNDIQLLTGLDKPGTDHKFVQSVLTARQKVSGNGLCDLDLPLSTRPSSTPATPAEMAEALRKTAKLQAQPLDYFIIGPASNLAAIIKELGAALASVIARITMLGGKLEPLWSEIPGADFNIASDPYALQDVMRSGVPLRFVPLNATWPIYLDLEDIEKLTPRDTLALWAKDLMIAHCRKFAPEPVFRFHDPSVLLAAQHEHAFTDHHVNLICDESSPDFGRLIADSAGYPCQIYVTDPSSQKLFLTSILNWLGLASPNGNFSSVYGGAVVE